MTEEKVPEHFWIVWDAELLATMSILPKYEDAVYKSIRLANENPGKKFYVLSAVAVSEATSVTHLLYPK